MGQAVRGAPGAGRGGTRTVALIAGLLLAGALPAQPGTVRVERGRYTVVADPTDSLLAVSLANRAAKTDTFPGLPRPREPVLIQLAPDAAAFRSLIGGAAPEWGAAFAFPGERRVVMQGSAAPSSAGDPRKVLVHELAHLALHEAMGDLPPQWFDEGYASFSAGEWDREALIAANIGLALGGFRTLAALDSGFRGGARRADAAYALSYRAVAELAELDPRQGLTRLFRTWKEEGSLDRALRRGYGLTLGGFEKRWVDRTRRRYGGLALFADVSVGAFVLLLVITPLWLLRRRRDRARLAAMRAVDALAEQREREGALEALLRSVESPRGSPPAEGEASS